MKKRKPIICYIHIPKCFGTSVIEYLDKFSPFYVHHYENSKINHQDIINVSNGIDWISGHCTVGTFMNFTCWSDRITHFYSSIRNPHDRVISEINYNYKNFANKIATTNSKKYKELLLDLLSVNTLSEVSIAAHLAKYSNYYFNLYSKYLFDSIYFEQDYLRLLDKYQYIATEEDTSNLLTSFGYETNPAPLSITNQNDNYAINKEIFNEKKIKDLMEKLNATDNIIYEAVKSHSFKNRTIKREKYLKATLENFNAQFYLNANPDLLHLSNNYDDLFNHFQLHGIGEGRRISTTPLAPESMISYS